MIIISLHYIEAGWISVSYKRSYKSSLTTAFICLPFRVFKVEGTTASLSISSLSDSWSEDKLESKSESYSSTTSCSSFPMTSSSYIGRFIAHADWHGQYASWKFCCLLLKLWVIRTSTVQSKGVTSLTHASWISRIVAYCVLPSQQLPRNVTERREASEFTKRHFFKFLTLNNRGFLKKASTFCINFLLKVFCVSTLLHIRLRFVIHTLTIAKKGLYTLSSYPHWHPQLLLFMTRRHFVICCNSTADLRVV